MSKGKMRKIGVFTMPVVVLLAVAATGANHALAAAEGVTLADFAWLAGQWAGGQESGRAGEEIWTEPRAGVMMGMFRLVKADKTLVLEFLSLRETPEAIELRVRHFSPALEPWEHGQPLILKLTEYNGTEAVFENPVHNHPKRSVIQRTGPDSFVGWSEIIRDNGETETIRIALQRVPADTQDAGGPAPSERQSEQRMIRKQVVVSAPLAEIWRAWTTEEGLTSFFGPRAHIEPVVGGPFEIYFDPSQPYGLRGSEGCKIHSLVPMKLLAFQWSTPPSLPVLRQLRTLVFVRFKEQSTGQTRVEVTHMGWGAGEQWDKAYEYFTQGWDAVLGNLRYRFAVGPVKWPGRFIRAEQQAVRQEQE